MSDPTVVYSRYYSLSRSEHEPYSLGSSARRSFLLFFFSSLVMIVVDLDFKQGSRPMIPDQGSKSGFGGRGRRWAEEGSPA